jgi:sulfite reductase beta subunit-like hemoprotein
LQLPNGEINAEQLRYAASVIRKYGKDGCADITTRANLQLRGVKLEDADGIIEGLIERNMGSFQSGMDSVRNLTGSPIAGLDPHELFDTRWAACLCVTGFGVQQVVCCCAVLWCVCNLTGGPIAGLDPHELFDTRWAACLRVASLGVQQVAFYSAVLRCAPNVTSSRMQD